MKSMSFRRYSLYSARRQQRHGRVLDRYQTPKPFILCSPKHRPSPLDSMCQDFHISPPLASGYSLRSCLSIQTTVPRLQKSSSTRISKKTPNRKRRRCSLLSPRRLVRRREGDGRHQTLQSAARRRNWTSKTSLESLLAGQTRSRELDLPCALAESSDSLPSRSHVPKHRNLFVPDTSRRDPPAQPASCHGGIFARCHMLEGTRDRTICQVLLGRY